MMKPLAWAIPLIALMPLGAAAQVPGSYQRSCSNVSQDGPVLSAVCRGSNGQLTQTTLDLRRCGGQGVYNSFGQLACGNVRGSARPVRGGYGDRGPRGYDGGPPPRGYGYDAPPPRRYDPDDDEGYRPPPPPPRRYDPDQDY